jgi:hypothetical protein
MNRKWWYAVVSILLLIHGWYCVDHSRTVEQHALQLPEMTCDQLVQNGPGRNNYLKLTDVRLCTRGEAFSRDMDAALQTFIPIYSARLGQEPRPGELRLLLEILDDRDRDALLACPGPVEFACEIWTRADQLDEWVYRALESKYPGIQVRKCRVVTVGLHEPTAVKAHRSWWYGILSFLIGGSLLGWLVFLRPATLVVEGEGDLHDPRPVETRSMGGEEFRPGLDATGGFHEVQRPAWKLHLLRSWWLVLIPGLIGSPLLAEYTESILPPASIAVLVVCLWGVLFGLLWGYFYLTRMVTRVTKAGVVVDLSFSEGTSIPHDEIETARLQAYDPDAAFGRFAVETKDRMVFWVAGGQSVELTLRDGKRLQIGTQWPRELLSAVETRCNKPTFLS